MDECTKSLLERHKTQLNYIYKLSQLLREFLDIFLLIQDNFERDEVETMPKASEKRKKPEKTPVRSKDVISMLRTVPILFKLSQVPKLIEID